MKGSASTLIKVREDTMQATMDSTMQLSLFAAIRSASKPAPATVGRRPQTKTADPERAKWKAMPLTGVDGVYYISRAAPGLAVIPDMGEDGTGEDGTGEWTAGELWGVMRTRDGKLVVKPGYELEKAQRMALEVASGKMKDKILRCAQNDTSTAQDAVSTAQGAIGFAQEIVSAVANMTKVVRIEAGQDGRTMTVGEILAMDDGGEGERYIVGQYEGPEYSPFRPKRGSVQDVPMVMQDVHDVERWAEAASLALEHCERWPIGIWSENDREVIAIVYEDEFGFV